MPRPTESPRDLAIKLATNGPHKVLPTDRRVRVLFNGKYIATTTRAVFVWEHPFYPQYWIPEADFDVPFSDKDKIEVPVAGDDGDAMKVGQLSTIKVGDRSAEGIIIFYPTVTGPGAPLAGLVKVPFNATDQWFEEDTPINVHPKDPFKRVDTLLSSRRVVVRVGGKVVADSGACGAGVVHLYETGLPCRYYLPRTAIDQSVLRPSKTVTRCPYKGAAEYFSVEVEGKVYEDLVWFYNQPLLEVAKVEGLCCFYNEKVEIELDGKILEPPQSPWSKTTVGGKPNLS